MRHLWKIWILWCLALPEYRYSSTAFTFLPPTTTSRHQQHVDVLAQRHQQQQRKSEWRQVHHNMVPKESAIKTNNTTTIQQKSTTSTTARQNSPTNKNNTTITQDDKLLASQLESKQEEPNAVDINLAVTSLCQSGQGSRALQLLKNTATVAETNMPVETYDMVLSCIDWKEALRLLHLMEEDPEYPKPVLTSYGAVMESCVKAHQVERAFQILVTMPSKGIQVCAVLCCAVLCCAMCEY